MNELIEIIENIENSNNILETYKLLFELIHKKNEIKEKLSNTENKSTLKVKVTMEIDEYDIDHIVNELGKRIKVKMKPIISKPEPKIEIDKNIDLEHMMKKIREMPIMRY